MIKICYVIGTLNIGGAEKQLLMLTDGLDKKKFEPVVISLRKNGDLKKDFESAGIKVVETDKKFKIDPIFFFRLFYAIKKEKPEILHTFMFTSNTWGRIAGIFNRVPIIISSERCVDLYKKWYHRLIDNLLIHFTKIIIANSYAVKDFYQNRERIPETRIKVIHNGIDIKTNENNGILTSKIKELGLENAKHIISCAGRFTEQKGFIYLIKAIPLILKEFPLTYFVFIGDGPLKDVFKKEVQKSGIEKNVLFTGYRKDVSDIFSISDIVAVPSLFEGMPNVVLEAMIAKKPVIGTNIPEISEIIKDAINGILVPVKNSYALAEKIIYLLKNPSIALKIGQEGYTTVIKEYSSEKMIQAYENIYIDCLGLKV